MISPKILGSMAIGKKRAEGLPQGVATLLCVSCRARSMSKVVRLRSPTDGQGKEDANYRGTQGEAKARNVDNRFVTDP